MNSDQFYEKVLLLGNALGKLILLEDLTLSLPRLMKTEGVRHLCEKL